MTQKLCIATVCSANHYSCYVPTFLYSAHKAYPDADVKVYVLGELREEIKTLLDEIPAKNYEITENAFIDYPIKRWTSNALRHLLPVYDFVEYSHIFICDVDFVFVKQGKPMLKYYDDLLDACGEPYATFRGHTNKEWDGNKKRLGEGFFVIKTPEWFKQTAQARSYYEKRLKELKSDSFDDIKPGTYREYGEVLLYRICKASKMRTPNLPWCFLNNKKVDMLYRQVHLGDFKFGRRHKNWSKMIEYLPFLNVVSYAKMFWEDKEWDKLCAAVGSISEKVGDNLKRAHAHIKERYKAGV